MRVAWWAHRVIAVTGAIVGVAAHQSWSVWVMGGALIVSTLIGVFGPT